MTAVRTAERNRRMTDDEPEPDDVLGVYEIYSPVFDDGSITLALVEESGAYGIGYRVDGEEGAVARERMAVVRENVVAWEPRPKLRDAVLENLKKLRPTRF